MRTVIDLFSGLGGFSAAFKARRWKVITYDIEQKFNPDHCIDIMDVQELEECNAIVASPPCTEFSKSGMPWFPDIIPDCSLILHTKELIEKAMPQFWAIENVVGSVRWFKPILGEVRQNVGSRFLWGNFPIFQCEPQYGKAMLFPTPERAALRAIIPYPLSKAMCLAMENSSLSKTLANICSKGELYQF